MLDGTYKVKMKLNSNIYNKRKALYSVFKPISQKPHSPPYLNVNFNTEINLNEMVKILCRC